MTLGTGSRFAFLAMADEEGGFAYPDLLRSLQSQADFRWQLYVGGTRAASTLIADERVTVLAETPTLPSLVAAFLEITDADYFTVVEQEGKLTSNALKSLSVLLEDEADIVYSDELHSQGDKTRPRPVLKPGFSPERLRCQFYLGNCVFYRTGLVRELGGLRVDRPGAELYDLALRIAARAPRVVHDRSFTFLAAEGAPDAGAIRGEVALESTRRALADYLQATGGGYVESVGEAGVHRTHRPIVGTPLVSIVIPSRGSSANVRGRERTLLIDCVRSVIEKSTYENYEIVVVMDTVAPADVVQSLREIVGDRLKLVWWDRPFSFSAKMNKGVFESSGDFVLFLNDDTEVISPGWIEALLSLCQLRNAGMSGAMLYFEDDSIQHAGHIYEAGDAGHIGTEQTRGDRGPADSFLVEREVSGVTAACAMMPRSVFEEAGGFSLLLPNNFNDVDLCMKVGQLGYQIYWTPYCELYHYESKTRVSRVTRYEVDMAWGRWQWRLNDPTYWPYGSLSSST